MACSATRPIRMDRLRVQNFKSFGSVDVTFGDLNVFVGANAAGKSNFMQIFNFISDIADHGLDNAISIQGGTKFLRNLALDSSQNLMIELTVSLPSTTYFPSVRHSTVRIRIEKLTYRFELQLGKRSGFKVLDDRVTFACLAQTRADNVWSKPMPGEIVMRVVKHRPILESKFPPESDIEEHYIRRHFPPPGRIPAQSLLLQYWYMFVTTPYEFEDFASDLSPYCFDPKLAKRAVPRRGSLELEKDGSNLAVSLKHILENDKSETMFSNLISYMLPFVDKATIEQFTDKSILFKPKESYFKTHTLPSVFASDGTISITDLILALYFQDSQITVIEEPERNIHPSLTARIVEMMREASKFSQVVATTNSPEMVRHVGIDNVYLVSRNRSGLSRIVKPAEIDEVKSLLESDMGIEELYVQNMLEG